MAGEGEDGEEGRDKSGSVLSAVAPPGGSGSTDAGPMRPREASVDTGGGGAGGGLCSVPIIAPFTTRKLTWDLWVGLLIVYSALSIPFRIGFGVDTTPTWRALDLVTDFFFLLDIITNFHTAFVHPRTGVLVVSRSAIAAKYMRGWFPIDFASTFPFDLVVDLATGGSADNATLRSTRLLRILRLARLLKLMRLSRLSRLLGQLKSWNGHGASQTAFSLLRLTLYLTIVAHFIACFWYGVSSDTPADSAMVSWVVGAGLNQNTTLGLNYTVSLYWAFTSMTTVGYGDIYPGTDQERAFTIAALLVGASAFGYIVGSVSLMLEQIDTVRAEFRDKMDRLTDYVRYRELPSVLATRLRRHTKYYYTNHTVFNERSVLDALPRVLRARLLVHSRARMLRTFRLLRTRQEWEPLFIADIAQRMQPQFVSAGEPLFEEGDLPQSLTIVLSGEVELCVLCRHPEHLPPSVVARFCEERPSGDGPGSGCDLPGEPGSAAEEKEPRGAGSVPDAVDGEGGANPGVRPLPRSQRVEAFALAGGVAALRCLGSARERAHAASVAVATAASGVKQRAWRQRRETNFLFAVRRRGESVGETSVAYRTPHDCTATAAEYSEAVVITVDDVRSLRILWPDFDAKLEAQAEGTQRSIESFRARLLQWLCEKVPRVRPQPGLDDGGGAGTGSVSTPRPGPVDEDFKPEVEASAPGTPVAPTAPSALPASGEDAPRGGATQAAAAAASGGGGSATGSDGASRSRRWLVQHRIPSFLRLEAPISSRALPLVQPLGARSPPSPTAPVGGQREREGGGGAEREAPTGPTETASPAQGAEEGARRPDAAVAPAGGGSSGPEPESSAAGDGDGHPPVRRSRLRNAAQSLRRAQSVGASFIMCGGLNGRSANGSVPGLRSSLDRTYSFRNVLQAPTATTSRMRCMLRPQQPSKVGWDLWVAVLIIYSTVTVPYRLAFGQSGVKVWPVLDTVTDLCFFIDIMANFRTAYLDSRGVLVWDTWRIALRYLRTWFLLDLVSTLPLDWLVVTTAQGSVDDSVALRSTKMLRVLRLARLLKLTRVLKLSRILGTHEEAVACSPAALRLLRLLLAIAFVAHLNGCLWFGVADAADSTSWINARCVDASSVGGHGPRCIADLHTAEQYLASVFWAITTQTTVGYGDITPSLSRPAELWVAIVSILMGTIIFAYVVGAVMELVMNSDPAGYLFKQGMRSLRDFLLEFEALPSSLCSSARKQYAYHMTRRGVYADSEMLHGAPAVLRNATLRFVHRNGLLSAPLLSAMEQAHPGFLSLLDSHARVRALQRGEFVQVPGEPCHEAWFVLRGRLQVWRDGRCEGVVEAGEVACAPALYLPRHIPGYARTAVVVGEDVHIAAVPPMFVEALGRVAPAVCDRFLEAVGGLDMCSRVSHRACARVEARIKGAGSRRGSEGTASPSDADDGAKATLPGSTVATASRADVDVAIRAARFVSTHGALATRLYRLPTSEELPPLVRDMASGGGPHSAWRRQGTARSILTRATASFKWAATVAPDPEQTPQDKDAEKADAEKADAEKAEVAAKVAADPLVAVPRQEPPLDRTCSEGSLDLDGVEDEDVRQMLALIDDWIAVAHEDMPDLVAHLHALAGRADASEAAALKAQREGGLNLD